MFGGSRTGKTHPAEDASALTAKRREALMLIREYGAVIN